MGKNETASLGMMQGGLSPNLFKNWFNGAENGVIISGFFVKSTLGKTIFSESKDILPISDSKLSLNLF